MSLVQPALSLPNFPIQFIQANDTDFDTFTQQQTTLPDVLKSKNSGLILYFYPKDNTAGCSTQAQDFSQYQDDFAKLGYQVIGVSRDNLKSHQKFITTKHITFPLISDSEQQLCDYFGVIGEKNMYGKKVLGVFRSTFVFDRQGNLLHQLRNVKAKEHGKMLLELLAK